MIELLYKEMCPYSQKVLTYVRQNGLDDKMNFKEVTQDSSAMERLQSLTGKTQVPCLVVDDEPMLESADIIRWLEGNLAKDQPDDGKAAGTTH